MIINEYVQNRSFSYNTETKVLEVDAMSENSFGIDINSIKTLVNHPHLKMWHVP